MHKLINAMCYKVTVSSQHYVTSSQRAFALLIVLYNLFMPHQQF